MQLIVPSLKYCNIPRSSELPRCLSNLTPSPSPHLAVILEGEDGYAWLFSWQRMLEQIIIAIMGFTSSRGAKASTLYMLLVSSPDTSLERRGIIDGCLEKMIDNVLRLHSVLG